MLEELTNFLIVNNCYRKFQTNLVGHKGMSITEFCSKYHYSEWLDRCFSWDETSEGREFWSHLNAEWVNLQDQNRKKNARASKIM